MSKFSVYEKFRERIFSAVAEVAESRSGFHAFWASRSRKKMLEDVDEFVDRVGGKNVDHVEASSEYRIVVLRNGSKVFFTDPKAGKETIKKIKDFKPDLLVFDDVTYELERAVNFGVIAVENKATLIHIKRNK